MKEIRRKDRILDKDSAVKLLLEGEYGFLAMANEEGGGYGIPLSYVYNGSEAIYFHCAVEGHKLDNLQKDNRVTFTVVGNTQVLPDKFSTLYQSSMVFGKIVCDLSDEERIHALRLIAEKYSPGLEEMAEKYIKGALSKTVILKLVIENITAKAKK